jgi:hypothetical protein
MAVVVTALITAVIIDTVAALADGFTDGSAGLRTSYERSVSEHVTCRELYKTVCELLVFLPFFSFFSFRFLYLELLIEQVVAYFVRNLYLN